MADLIGAVVVQEHTWLLRRCAAELELVDIGAGDILQLPTSAPLNGPVSVALSPRPFRSGIWTAGVADGEILLRSNSLLASSVPALDEQE